MLDLAKTSMHRVYKTELRGDALVVTLQGDAPGFSIGAVHNEMATVIGLARCPEVRNLIVDMSGTNYYGSLILGEIVNLGQAVREKGGRIALAGVSPDMKEILRMMRLDAMWERYPNLSMALRALGNVSLQDRLKVYAKPAAIAGGALVLLLLFFLIPRADRTPEYYKEARAIWEEAQQKRAARLDDSEWQHFARRADRKLEELTRHLRRIAGPDNEAGRSLLYLTRDYAGKAIEKHLDPADANTKMAEYYLALAKATIEHTEPPLPPDQSEKSGQADAESSASAKRTP